MKKAIYHLSIFILILQSCTGNENGNNKKYVPPSSGTHAELLIVTDDILWQSDVGKSLIGAFGREQYGLPQPESIFSINKVAPAGFQGLLKKAKSLVFVEIGDTTLIKTQYNVWAEPQIVTTLIAPNKAELKKLIDANDDNLVNAYHQADLAVVRNRMKGNIYKTLPPSLSDFGVKSMYLQLGFEQTLDKADIKIFRQTTKKTEQFLIFSSRPMNEEILPGQDIVAARDSIGKKYFEGSADDSYFGTEKLIPPQQTSTEINGQFAIETRGMWKTHGDFMGGPFISYSFYDDKNGRILTVEGLIYGPDAKKRNVLLELEGMITSIKFK